MKEAIWIREPKHFEECVNTWLAMDHIALDTEFERRNTFYAKPGLIQIATLENTYLIDPLALQDLTPLKRVLEANNVVKVMHSISEDVDLLAHETGAVFQRVFDTQIAAALTGIGYALGYQKLVEACLGVELDKSETRSNWLQRPLTDSQIKYACLDTEYLLKLYPKLFAELEQKNLIDAVFEETDQLVAQNKLAQTSENAHLKLRGGWHLSIPQQKQLAYLIAWRDSTARTRDLPKSWIFSDNVLLHVVEKPPRSTKDLNRIKDIKHKSVRLHGPALMEEIEASHRYTPEHFQAIQKPIRGGDQQHTKAIKKIVNRISQEEAIEPQVLCPKKLLETIVLEILQRPRPKTLSSVNGWRAHYLSKSIQTYINENLND